MDAELRKVNGLLEGGETDTKIIQESKSPAPAYPGQEICHNSGDMLMNGKMHQICMLASAAKNAMAERKK